MCKCKPNNFGSLCYIAPRNSTRLYYVLGFWANPFGGAVYAVVQHIATGQRNPRTLAKPPKPMLVPCTVCPSCGGVGMPSGWVWPRTANGVPLLC